ncbi:unnamed protein product [[Candida] boidinii]|uniref:Unnamed protein product n=1 Tax=Candida boidinii TaxID=5477 RepID=A0A9W6T616_CANBO|nr:unnamed protein product [[Candida] boidinii]GMF98078.1 unnamed protein product [[Candida] boidinii]GMG24124.1 unnamed protein product [[Candida] boidinii]
MSNNINTSPNNNVLQPDLQSGLQNGLAYSGNTVPGNIPLMNGTTNLLGNSGNTNDVSGFGLFNNNGLSTGLNGGFLNGRVLDTWSHTFN